MHRHEGRGSGSGRDQDTDAARLALNDKSLRSAETAWLGTLEKLDALHRGAMEQAKNEAVAYATGRNLLIGATLLGVALASVPGKYTHG